MLRQLFFSFYSMILYHPKGLNCRNKHQSMSFLTLKIKNYSHKKHFANGCFNNCSWHRFYFGVYQLELTIYKKYMIAYKLY